MKKIFSSRLKELIGSNSVRGFATKIGIPQQSIDRYIKEERTPNGDAIINICQACNCSANWLLGLPEKRPSPTEPVKPCTECQKKDEIITALSKSLENANASIRDFTTTVPRTTTEAPKKAVPALLPRRKP